MRRARLCLAVLATTVLAPTAGTQGANTFTFKAADFDDGNVQVSLTGESYADGHSCIWNRGELPNRAEYVVDLPVTANYALFGLYAAAAARPVEISVDGKKVHSGFSGVTGSWQTKSAKWEQQCALRLEAGTHAILLRCEGPFPHICALRLESSEPFPEGRVPRRLSPEQRSERVRHSAEIAALQSVNVKAVRRAIADMQKDFPEHYDGALYLQALAKFERGREGWLASRANGGQAEPEAPGELLADVRRALLANPLLDFDKVLVVQRNFSGNKARQATGADAGFVPHNYENHNSIRRSNWDNEVMVLSGLRTEPRLERLYKPGGSQIVRDIRLHFDADRILFSQPDTNGRWAVYEMRRDGSAVYQVTPTNYPDLDFFDPCYLPNGRIILCSTAGYYGLPCLDGNGEVASLYLLDPATKTLRQLTFDQDSDNDPVLLNDGRVLYQRWEYSDIPHYFSRRRFAMNPDGTGQLAVYGSNSWFPTAFRFAKPVPDHPTLLVGIISGHHDYGDCGRMALLDPGLAGGYPFRYRPASKEWGTPGQKIALTPDVLPAEETGFLQLVPGWGKPVAGTVCDAIVGDVYKKEHPSLTTHPYPLSSKYFLVSMKPTDRSLWGIYLVDIFDNATLIVEVEGSALFEPVPLRPRPRPPVIPDRVDPGSKTADVHIGDIYAGPGLRGVPPGTVKRVRVFAYHFGYHSKAGFNHVGIQSGWDVKRVLGTARVEEDGSAHFQIPANTPISIQPLDSEGRAVQLMRSWLVGMPGERVSCVGCHENRRATLPSQRTVADRRVAEPLEPWFGPPRPFHFAHEIYPVLEKHCIGCHDGPGKVGPRSKPSFRTADSAYNALHPYVHRPGVEADMALLNPMEYHASTSVLIQMLEKGHHGVRLFGMDREARERLHCWIDLNVPRNGHWTPPDRKGHNQVRRRLELARAFASLDTNPEDEFRKASESFKRRAPVTFVAPPEEQPVLPDNLEADGFPMGGAAAVHLQQTGPNGCVKVVNLGEGVKMRLRWVPAGEFLMGGLDGAPDERPRVRIRIAKPFWMAENEVSNAQYALFAPEHDTRYIDMHYMDRVTPGYIANHPDQPAARVSWQEAMQFCAWLSRRTELKAALPTEAQWEWAARAGSDTQFHHGTMDADFGRFANLADQSIRWFKMGFPGASQLQPRHPYPPEMNFPLHDERFRDTWHVVDYVGQTEPNTWGLRDMVGNVSEWTRTSYQPYPYTDDDGRNDGDSLERKVARGGSWADRPANAGSSVRRAYESWQKVYDVGFRIIVE